MRLAPYGGRRLGTAPFLLVAVVACAAIVAASAFTSLYVGAEQPAYFWDYGGYFGIYIKFVDLLSAPGHGWKDNLWWGVAHDDYNATSVVPLTLFGQVFGPSRLVYVLSLVLLYLLPVCWLMTAMSLEAAGLERRVWASGSACIVFACALFSWPLWIATLRGMPDIVGLLPLGIATLVILRTRYLTQASYPAAAVVGLALWSAFLLRRWYAYSCVSLIVVSFVCAAWLVLSTRPLSTGALARLLTKFAVLVLAIILPLAYFQRPLVMTILTTNYTDAYAMYQKPLLDTLGFVFGIFGLGFCVLVALGLSLAVYGRRSGILFCVAVALLDFLVFTRTQAPGEQHVLPFYAFLFPALAYVVVSSLEASSRALRVSAGVAMPVLMATTFLFVFWPSANATLAGASRLFPSWSVFPLQLENYATYMELMGSLRGLSGDGARIVVLSSTDELSGSTVAALDRPLSRKVEQASEVDRRDGLKLGPLYAELAVVSDPPAVSAPSFQVVVSGPDQMILDGRGYGSAYARVAGPFILAHGLRVFVYRRSRPMTPEDRTSLVEEMRKTYPAWSLRTPDRVF